METVANMLAQEPMSAEDIQKKIPTQNTLRSVRYAMRGLREDGRIIAQPDTWPRVYALCSPPKKGRKK